MADLREQLERTLTGVYTIERELAGGGMSRVFVGTEIALDRTIVVKVLPEDTATSVSADRFSREIKLAARLQHPHIVPLISAGQTAEGIPFYTMPFVRGESLKERLERSGEMSVTEAIRTMRDVAGALAYAHGEGVVHRDIKPANVMLSGGVAVVTDFGVAKAYDAAAQSKDATRSGITSLGVALGTPAYMSPEQASADPHVDHRADIYSFGVMAYELLAGASPFANRTPAQLLAAHVQEKPEPLERRRPGLPVALTRLVTRCLEKRPADRPQSADEIVRELDALATPSGGMTPTEAASANSRRRSFAIAGAALIVVALVAVAVMRKSAATPSGTTAKSIAVLPFTALGGDKSNDFFSEGMTEELTGALARLPGLRVPARSVATAAATKETDVQKVGAFLGVDAVLLGTVQRAGDRVRIGAQLINVGDGLHMWSGQYDGDVKDVFKVQDSIAKAIVSALKIQLASGPSRELVHAATGDPEAHNLYLQGMYLWNRRTTSTMPGAIDYLERATKRDPTYARAYAGLALALATSPDYTDVDVSAAVAKAVDAARRAIALDSTSVDAYTAMGNAYARLFKNAAADSAYQKALQIDSTYATVWHWRAILLDHIGKMDEAVRAIKRARQLDPTSLIIAANVGMVLTHARRFAEADSAERIAVTQDPTFVIAHRHLAIVLMHEKQYDAGLAENKLSLELQAKWVSVAAGIQAYMLAEAGHTVEARAALADVLDLGKTKRISKATVATVYSILGDMDTAIRYLKDGVDEYDPTLTNLSRDPRFDRLRANPRGAALLARTERSGAR